MSNRYHITEHGPEPTPYLAQFAGYEVGQWCPTPDGSGPPQAIVLEIKFGNGVELNGRRCTGVGLRLGSRHAVNTLIEILERHRDEVWPL